MVDFSFIICTRNRATQLSRTLESVSRAVKACPEHRFELVLADNGSTDTTAEVFDNWARSAEFEARRLFIATPGLALSRNVSINAAAGDIIVFTDDDCVLSETYCRELVEHFTSNVENRILGGRVELGDDNDIPFTIKRSLEGERLGEITHPGNILLGCNMVFTKKVLDDLGPFDERFGAGARYRSGEETDMVYRARRHGIVVEYVPDMVVYHFHGRRTRTAVEQLNYGYHYRSGALYAKYFFTDPGLSKHMYWALRSAIREGFGGPRFDPTCGLSNWTTVVANLSGLWDYAIDRFRDSLHTFTQAHRRKSTAGEKTIP
jgi:glycosyltransferase involved in cell wall biosynthesis